MFEFGIFLILLKIIGFISWPWWVVLLPIYAPLSITFLAITGATMIAGIATLLSK